MRSKIVSPHVDRCAQGICLCNIDLPRSMFIIELIQAPLLCIISQTASFCELYTWLMYVSVFKSAGVPIIIAILMNYIYYFVRRIYSLFCVEQIIYSMWITQSSQLLIHYSAQHANNVELQHIYINNESVSMNLNLINRTNNFYVLNYKNFLHTTHHVKP